MGRKWLFTFHYASTISSSAENIPRLIQALYIPLCFYYIAKIEDKFSNLYTSFTFHYASTISALDYNYFRIHSFFTFHYASTISKSPLSAICKALTLHSTMLLLYPVPVFPFYFLQYRYTFCLPPFLVDFFSKIIHLSLYKV